MNRSQQNKLSMYRTVRTKCAEHQAAWQPLPAFVEAHIDFTTQLTRLEDLAAREPTQGITAAKQGRRDALVEDALTIAEAVTAYAEKQKDAGLAARVDFSRSSLVGKRDEDTVSRAQQIHDAATEVVVGLADYGVDAARLTALQVAIDGFREAVPQPRAARASGKTRTKQLDDAFADLDRLLEKRLDNLAGQFRKGAATFYTDYTNARIIVDLGGGRGGEETPAAAAPPAAAS